MRLRRVRLCDSERFSTAVWDEPRTRWVPLARALELIATPPLDDARDDLIAFLAGGEQALEAAAGLCEALASETFSATFELGPILPFTPKLLRAFTSWERHWTQSARGLVRHYTPQVAAAIEQQEQASGETDSRLLPGALYEQRPSFYIGNHLTIEAAETTIPWPGFCLDLDFELELAAILCRPVRDVRGPAALAAIGGFTVFNDLSARDVQWEEQLGGIFGPLGKTKSFASVMGLEVVTADEVLPHLDTIRAEVRVNGETWSRTATAGMKHDFADLVAYSANGEQLYPGEIISSGTMPNGCGLEFDRWLQPNDQLELEIERVGTAFSRIGERPPVTPLRIDQR